MKKNTNQLKYLFHCINFLHVAEELYSSVKVKDSEIKFKDEKLKHVNSLKELLDYHMEIYSKNNNSFDKKQFEHFFRVYDSCSKLYEKDFRKNIGGKDFMIQFDFSPKKQKK